MQVSQIKVGSCYHLNAFVQGIKIELGVFSPFIQGLPLSAREDLRTFK